MSSRCQSRNNFSARPSDGVSYIRGASAIKFKIYDDTVAAAAAAAAAKWL